MNEQLFTKYAKIKLQIRELEAEAKEMNEGILNELLSKKVETLDTDLGKFTVATKTTYTYSPKVKTLEEDLKVLKNKEVEKGTAKPKATNYLLFTTPKE